MRFLGHGSRGWPWVLALAALASVLIGVVGLWARVANGEPAPAGGAVVSASGEAVPGRLPRSRMVPASLRVGFTSASPGTSVPPELTAIGIEVSHDLSLQTAGLPSCPISEMYYESSVVAQRCAGSLVGSGLVTSEVTLAGQSPVVIEGRLSAFYDLGEGQPRILARVESTAPVSLIYVIPFTIHRTPGVFGTTLSVAQMRFIAGLCIPANANCFSQTYTYKGIYGHISKFELTLSRRFVHAGRMASFVSADCPARGRSSSALLPLVKVNLEYPFAISRSRSQVVTRRCEVSAPRRRSHRSS